jgi:hypothetical protein
MMSFEEARQIALQEINPQPRVDPFGEELVQHVPCVLLDQYTMTLPYGWLFFYQSERYVLGDKGAQLIGNSPFIVTRIDGAVHYIGTAGPPDELRRKWELREGAKYIGDASPSKPRWL